MNNQEKNETHGDAAMVHRDRGLFARWRAGCTLGDILGEVALFAIGEAVATFVGGS
jgi:hypothetical protein